MKRRNHSGDGASERNFSIAALKLALLPLYPSDPFFNGGGVLSAVQTSNYHEYDELLNKNYALEDCKEKFAHERGNGLFPNTKSKIERWKKLEKTRKMHARQ